MWQEREKREETSSPETEKKTIFLRNGIAFFFFLVNKISLSVSLSRRRWGASNLSLSLLPQAAAENDGLLRGTRKKKWLSLCFFFVSFLSFSLSLASSFTTKKGACDACGPSFKVSTFSLSLVNGRCSRSLRRVKTCVCVCVGGGGCLVAKRNETILYRGGRENELMKKKMKLF